MVLLIIFKYTKYNHNHNISIFNKSYYNCICTKLKGLKHCCEIFREKNLWKTANKMYATGRIQIRELKI